ncbi:MAG: Fic family protein [Deltaproteobacteria bacterium]|nr:Fic family protein [Deltaproteobacteria bacterium]
MSARSAEIRLVAWIWTRREWPEFRWDAGRLLPAVTAARLAQGRLLGAMESLGFALRLEAELHSTVEDVLTTSAIEGTVLPPASVRSSVAHRLGLDEAGVTARQRDVEGVVDVVMDATRNCTKPVTAARLFGWHAALFPTGRSGLSRIRVGRYRDDAQGPMQVVSGALGRPTVHFEAPPAKRLPAETRRLLDWLARPPPTVDGLLGAGLVHLWFVTLHPFDDGNGRLARALADLALARADGLGQRFFSVSSQLERERRAYYEALEATQRGGLDVTPWLEWFSGCVGRAVAHAETQALEVRRKAAFWQAHAAAPFSPRQQKLLARLLDDPSWRLTAKHWATVCRCSADTAARDIQDLVGRGLLARNPGEARNTSYRFAWSGGDVTPAARSASSRPGSPPATPRR